MQISKLYETKLECSSYNVNIDSTDTTVTLTLVDFNGSPVTNTAVTLKADKGYFTKAVGKTTTNYTDASATKSINVTTDNYGKVVATWTASEWGLCTFSANNTTVQVLIKGYRTYSNNRYTIYHDEKMCHMQFSHNYTDEFPSRDEWSDFSSVVTVPSELSPDNLVVITTSFYNFYHLIRASGVMAWKNKTGAKITPGDVQFSVSWKKA